MPTNDGGCFLCIRVICRLPDLSAHMRQFKPFNIQSHLLHPNPALVQIIFNRKFQHLCLCPIGEYGKCSLVKQYILSVCNILTKKSQFNFYSEVVDKELQVI